LVKFSFWHLKIGMEQSNDSSINQSTNFGIIGIFEHTNTNKVLYFGITHNKSNQLGHYSAVFELC